MVQTKLNFYNFFFTESPSNSAVVFNTLFVPYSHRDLSPIRPPFGGSPGPSFELGTGDLELEILTSRPPYLPNMLTTPPSSRIFVRANLLIKPFYAKVSSNFLMAFR